MGINQEQLDLFIRSLSKSDQEILEKFHLSINGRPLTETESVHFLQFLREEISIASEKV